MSHRVTLKLPGDVGHVLAELIQNRALTLHGMRRERHNHTSRHRELEWVLQEQDADIADIVASAMDGTTGSVDWEVVDDA